VEATTITSPPKRNIGNNSTGKATDNATEEKKEQENHKHCVQRDKVTKDEHNEEESTSTFVFDHSLHASVHVSGWSSSDDSSDSDNYDTDDTSSSSESYDSITLLSLSRTECDVTFLPLHSGVRIIRSFSANEKKKLLARVQFIKGCGAVPYYLWRF